MHGLRQVVAVLLHEGDDGLEGLEHSVRGVSPVPDFNEVSHDGHQDVVVPVVEVLRHAYFGRLDEVVQLRQAAEISCFLRDDMKHCSLSN